MVRVRRIICVLLLSIMATGLPSVGETSASAFPSGDFIVELSDVISDPRAFADAVGGVEVEAVFENVMIGFGGHLTSNAHAALAGNPMVRSITPNFSIDAPKFEPVVTLQTAQADAIWSLDRIDQRNTSWDFSYTYPNDATGVTAYVIDTGIRPTHHEFLVGGTGSQSRVRTGMDAAGNGTALEDCNGHGTHVAGTIGGWTYGVAKNATIVPVRVFKCDGSGNALYSIDGIDWIVADHVKGTPAVANLSLGIVGTWDVFDNAIQSMIDDGITVVIAAGNSNLDACGVSPARAPNAITVAASNVLDYESQFGGGLSTNWGSCVDIYGPGSSIKSAAHDSDTGTSTKSGTSMASPLVAGVAAVYLGHNPLATPAQVTSAILEAATTDAIVDARSTNKLAYMSQAWTAYQLPNDDLASATSLATDAATGSAFSVDATKQTGEPNHASQTGGASVWWKFVAPADGRVSLDTAGSSFDTVLGVYTGSSVDALTQVAANNDTEQSNLASVSFDATSGTTYWIAVDGVSGASGAVQISLAWIAFAAPDAPTIIWIVPGQKTLSVYYALPDNVHGSDVNNVKYSIDGGETWKTRSPVSPTSPLLIKNLTIGQQYDVQLKVLNAFGLSVASNEMSSTPIRTNDMFTNAWSIRSDIAQTASTEWSSAEVGEPLIGGYSPQKSLWWTFTASEKGKITITTLGSSVDTQMSVFTGSKLTTLTRLALADDYGSFYKQKPNGEYIAYTKKTISVAKGVTYRIAVDTFRGAVGTVKLSVKFK